MGSRAALRAGLLVATAALATMALATRWWHLPLVLAVAGTGHAVLQVASNRLLADDVSRSIQGLAFGIKQSAVPAATLTAGASVPLVGTQLGWRWTYVAAAAVAGLVLLLQRRAAAAKRPVAAEGHSPASDEAQAFDSAALLLLAAAVGLAAAAANTLPAFLVAYAVDTGTPTSRAGVLLAAASAAGLLARVALGRWADRRGSTDLRWVSLLLLVGTGAFAALPHAPAVPAVLWATAALAFVCGWGWPGYVTFVVVRRNARAPATATGIVQAGVFTGAVGGPLLFGVTASALSYATAWRGAAIAQAVAAALVFALARRTSRPG